MNVVELWRCWQVRLKLAFTSPMSRTLSDLRQLWIRLLQVAPPVSTSYRKYVSFSLWVLSTKEETSSDLTCRWSKDEKRETKFEENKVCYNLIDIISVDVIPHIGSLSTTFPMQIYTLCLIKSSLFYFCDNFPNCKPIQIIFGRNIAETVWNRLTHDNFDIYLLCVASLHGKITPIFISVL